VALREQETIAIGIVEGLQPDVEDTVVEDPQHV
jgi:hypothetical protein